MRVDIHQHLWTEPFLAALAARDRAPRLRRAGAAGGGWTLETATEPPGPVDLAAHDPARRAALVAADGLDRALVCVSSPLGIEALPFDEARLLLDAHHDGVAALGAPFGGWAAVALDDPDPAATLGALLDRGFVGASLPAGALADVAGLTAAGPLLAAAERRDVPVLVHPGPGRGPGPGAGDPSWWPALVGYVAQMHAAWHTFAAAGRAAHPRLRIAFALLAGLAPLHAERLAARGGPPVDAVPDPGVFYDTSSYGPVAVAAMAARVGVTQIVHGSDRPVIAPDAGALAHLDAGAAAAIEGHNVTRLLGR